MKYSVEDLGIHFPPFSFPSNRYPLWSLFRCPVCARVMMSSIARFLDPGMREMDFGVKGNGSCRDREPEMARPGAD